MILEKIFLIMTEIGILEKDKTIQTKAGSYAVTSYDEVLTSLRDKLIENRIVVLRKDVDATMFGTNICLAKCVFVLRDLDDKDEIEVASLGAGYDSSDKMAGKALTYALKYALRDTFLLRSADDPDLSSSDKNAESAAAKQYSFETIMDTLDAALDKGKITDEEFKAFCESVRAVKGNKEGLKQAREYIRATLGI